MEPFSAVSGDRTAVEWWGSWVEAGMQLTLAGVTVLRLDVDGKVIDHRDYWNQVDGREPPYPGWVKVIQLVWRACEPSAPSKASISASKSFIARRRSSVVASPRSFAWATA